jgi:hypothetical protein
VRDGLLPGPTHAPAFVGCPWPCRGRGPCRRWRWSSFGRQ